ncbi:SET and MYND domain-containing protein 4-like [Cydia splendana]|uniref:SET and MYND domain-containing protein 4-like n=1 Tax=Cydia splendana TaxID=1100963 RepID=UPI0028F49857
MSGTNSSMEIPKDVSKQWEILLLLLSSEEKKIDRTCDCEVDTMNYFLKNEGVGKILLHWLSQMRSTYACKTSDSDTALKCDSVSLLWRQRGNEKFRASLLLDSYECYNKSVLYATQDGDMFPLALANRSAALLRMKKFKECLSDISLALSHGYPREQRHKLLLRRADCHAELRARTKALAALDEARAHAAELRLSPASTAEFERLVKIMENKMAAQQEAEVQNEGPLPELHMGENPNFVSASNAIELRQNETVGRHVVTTAPTRRGDALFSEEPYAWVALPSPEPVCEGCGGAGTNPVPCVTCSRSIYCSVECRVSATHHRWECPGATFNLYPTIGIAHLALRVLLVGAEDGFPPLPPSENPRTAMELFQGYAHVQVPLYARQTHPFHRMFGLLNNFDKMNNTDYIQYALTATMLTLYLENHTKFFSYLPSRVPYPLSQGQVRLFAAALLLRAMGQLVCNGHATLGLATVDHEDGRTVSEREVRRATAIYPSAAMMNHSCDPNIINTFYRNRLIVVCARELPANTEVLNCYGPARSREPAAHRRASLRAQYMFTCNCDACTDPQDGVLLFSAYLCQSCKGPVICSGSAKRAQCQQCHAPFQLQGALDTLERANELLLQAERAPSVEARIEHAHAAYKLKQQVLHRHHASLRAAADRLARHYADAGEFTKSVELIKQNIQSHEYQYGSFSVEVAHELRKLSDVMLERIFNSQQNPDYRDWLLETHKILTKAVQLTSLNYGSWEPLVARLKGHAAVAAALLAESRAPPVQSVHQELHYNLKI